MSMNLYLIGYRGSGKSTVGRALAELLDWDFLDTDDKIEAKVGKSIREIFASVGEEGFRQQESLVVKDLIELDRFVVSLGGGAVLAEGNREVLRETGKTVWLQVSAEKCFARIEDDQNSRNQRPNLTQTGGIEEIRQMLEIRSPIYQSCADLVIEADVKMPAEIAALICDHFKPILHAS